MCRCVKGIAMRKRNPKRQRRAAAAAAIALALALAWGGGNAFAQDDEEDVPLDTKLFRQLMKDVGLQKDGEGIDYRERAPLVVPPSLNLPPPQTTLMGFVNVGRFWAASSFCLMVSSVYWMRFR